MIWVLPSLIFIDKQNMIQKTYIISQVIQLARCSARTEPQHLNGYDTSLPPSQTLSGASLVKPKQLTLDGSGEESKTMNSLSTLLLLPYFLNKMNVKEVQKSQKRTLNFPFTAMFEYKGNSADYTLCTCMLRNPFSSLKTEDTQDFMTLHWNVI